jgi:hypothetical protein
VLVQAAAQRGQMPLVKGTIDVASIMIWLRYPVP